MLARSIWVALVVLSAVGCGTVQDGTLPVTNELRTACPLLTTDSEFQTMFALIQADRNAGNSRELELQLVLDQCEDQNGQGTTETFGCQECFVAIVNYVYDN